MKQTWRWYGPDDPVSLGDAKQAGVEGIVTALHHVTPGDIWSVQEIEKRKSEVALLPSGAPSGLTWDVVESVFISDDVKSQTGDWRTQLDNYKQTLRNLAACDVNVVAYHTMPVLDWSRTDLKWQHKNTGLALRFDFNEMAAFDIHILGRKGAVEYYPEEVAAAGAKLFANMSDSQKSTLSHNLTAGLPRWPMRIRCWIRRGGDGGRRGGAGVLRGWCGIRRRRERRGEFIGPSLNAQECLQLE